MLSRLQRSSRRTRGTKDQVLAGAVRPLLENLEGRRMLSVGGIDTSFSGDGFLTQNFNGPSGGQTLLVQADQKIIATSAQDGQQTIAIARYLPDGSPDSGFGDNGVVTLDPSGDVDDASAIVIANNALYVAGTASSGSNGADVFVTKLSLTDGSIIGTSTLSFAGDQNVSGIVATADGSSLYVAGNGLDVSGHAYLAHFDSSLALDTDFGDLSGVQTLTFGSPGAATINSMAIQPDDQILVAGTLPFASVARINPDGSMDALFGVNGVAVASQQFQGMDSLAVDSSGNIYTASTAQDVDGSYVEVDRFDSDGVQDATYGTGLGFAQLKGATNLEQYLSPGMTIDASDRVVVTGYYVDDRGSVNADPTIVSLLVARFTTAGALDNTFDADGVATFQVTPSSGEPGSVNPGSVDAGFAVAVQSDGNIVSTGFSNDDLLIVRFIGEEAVANSSPVLDTVQITSPIDENGMATLSGTYHDDDALDTHTLDIDWNGDGIYDQTVNVADGTFSVDHQYGDDANVTVQVRLNDNAGGSATGSVGLIVSNVAPTVNPIGGDTSGTAGQPVSFTGSFTDPETLDTWTVSWDFGDGNVIAPHSSTDAGALSPSHTYASAGTYTVTLTVQDDDGGVGTQQVVIVINAAPPATPVFVDGGGNLVVPGTGGNDVFTVTAQTDGIHVVYNGVDSGAFSPSGNIILDGSAGNDLIVVSAGVTVDVSISGGDGNDTLIGGSGNDSINGNAGDDFIEGGAGIDLINGSDGADIANGGSGLDIISGGAGRDLLIGGIDSDLLLGSADDDLLIGGTTSLSAADLQAVLTEWNGPGTYSQRVTNLQGGSGVNLIVSGTGTNVFDDGSIDLLVGGAASDWFLVNFDGSFITRDIILDKAGSEVRTDID